MNGTPGFFKSSRGLLSLLVVFVMETLNKIISSDVEAGSYSDSRWVRQILAHFSSLTYYLLMIPSSSKALLVIKFGGPEVESELD